MHWVFFARAGPLPPFLLLKTPSIVPWGSPTLSQFYTLRPPGTQTRIIRIQLRSDVASNNLMYHYYRIYIIIIIFNIYYYHKYLLCKQNTV